MVERVMGHLGIAGAIAGKKRPRTKALPDHSYERFLGPNRFQFGSAPSSIRGFAWAVAGPAGFPDVLVRGTWR